MKRQSLEIENCLMLLSCPKQKTIEHADQFECKTCNRKFSSFQALGGHRASHKRQKLVNGEELKEEAKTLRLWNQPKMHECSICGMGFSLGQALGGHMRKHRTSAADQLDHVSSSINHIIAKIPVLKRSNSKRVTMSMCFPLDLDLNLTPMENDLVLGMKSPPIPLPLSLF